MGKSSTGTPYLSFILLVVHQASLSIVKYSRNPHRAKTKETAKQNPYGPQYHDHQSYSRRQPTALYNPPTAIFLTECIKAFISFIILVLHSYRSYPTPQPAPSSQPTATPRSSALLHSNRLRFRFLHRLLHVFSLALGPQHHHQIVEMIVPAFLYTLQNQLLYVGLTELDTPIFLITSQLKIITTGLCSVLICGRRLVIGQWISLCTLGLGVLMVQLEPEPTDHRKRDGSFATYRFNLNSNQIKGIVSIIISSFFSGLAGCWFERSLKRNMKPKNQPSKVITIDHQNPSFKTHHDQQQQHHHHRNKYKIHSSNPSIVNTQKIHQDLSSILQKNTNKNLDHDDDLIEEFIPPSSNLWTKNLQLSIPSLVISFLMIYIDPKSRSHVSQNGFFFGFFFTLTNDNLDHHQSQFGHFNHTFSRIFSNLKQFYLVWIIILYHSLGGILASILVKQSDSLTKSFATCLSIILSVLVSSYSNKIELGLNFYLGSSLVFISIRLFSTFSSSSIHGKHQQHAHHQYQPLRQSTHHLNMSRNFKTL